MNLFEDVKEFIVGFGDLFFSKQEQEEPIEENIEVKRVRPKKFIYRPQNLTEYIGQERAKDRINLNLQKIINGKPVNFLLSGNAGCGKTTLAYLIGHHTGFKVNYFIGQSFTREDLGKFLVENENERFEMANILFIDEIHGLDKLLAEELYPILEDMQVRGRDITPFIFIGATTKKSVLIQELKPFVDRCAEGDITLEDYTAEDIEKIIKQFKEQIYSNETVSDEIYKIIGKNCRFTPRIAIALFNDFAICKNINRVLRAYRIIQDSLTDIDIKILQHMVEINKPVAKETLAIIAGMTNEEYSSIIEPFLIKSGFLARTSRGRLATEKTKQLLEGLKHE
jgi:holliday junction DNA helicase RuvB